MLKEEEQQSVSSDSNTSPVKQELKRIVAPEKNERKNFKFLYMNNAFCKTKPESNVSDDDELEESYLSSQDSQILTNQAMQSLKPKLS